jgi:prolyl oligopeptidase
MPMPMLRVKPILLGILSALVVLFMTPSAMPQATLTYPVSTTVDQIDDYHGTRIPDPYRWLENPDTPEAQAWIAAQNRVTFKFLEAIPQRQAIQQRLTQLWDYQRYDVPFKRGDRYFYFKNDGLQNQSVLYTLTDLTAEPTVLLDPNTLSDDGTVALAGIAISDDGQWLAYGLSTSGSDWQTWHVCHIPTGEALSDRLEWIKFSSVAWRSDGQGFFYSRYDAPNPNRKLEAVNHFQKLYYHARGTDQGDDVLIYHRPDHKEWGFNANVTEDGHYLIISVWRGTDPKNLLFYRDLTQPEASIVELIDRFEAAYSVVNSDGTTFWVQTDLDAPRGRLVAIDLNQPDRSHWRELIPQAPETLQSVHLLNHSDFVANYLKDAHSQIKRFDLEGRLLGELPLPGLGTVGGFDGKRQDSETFYSFTSFTTPTTIYRYDLVTQESQLFRQPQVAFEGSAYETEQVFYTSPDGTRVPMFITYKRRLKRDGTHPTLLYGYGGFNVSMTPSFSVPVAVWLELGGIYAVPNLRGGGEYGEAWHQAGMKHHKQKVFDDFMAAAEWLIAQGYTRPQGLAIADGSNGGLLVGACMTQRPELFGAALPAVGVMDMLRFHKFTIGWAWMDEYGSPDNPEDFAVLYAYSPLHHLKPGTAYPATLITTADHDDRVVPAHSFKFAAALQAAQAGAAPVLIRIETKAGHGAGKPTTKLIEEATDKWAFLRRVLAFPD